MKWYWKLILYLSSLVVAAVVGGIVKIQLDKASLDVVATSFILQAPSPVEALGDHIYTMLEGPKGDTDFKINPELNSMLDTSTWISTIDEEKPYVGELVVKEAKLIDVSNAMSALQESLTAWPQHINGESIAAIYKIIRDNREIIQGHIFGELRRDVTFFDDAPTDFSIDTLRDESKHKGFKKYYGLDVDADGDIYLKAGIERLPILWSMHRGVVSPESTVSAIRYVAWRLARAIQTANETDLLVIKDHINAILQEHALLNAALKITRSELEGLSHWMVTATVANNGGTPVAISPNGALYIKFRGYLPKSKDSSQDKLNENIRISLQLVKSSMIPIPDNEGLQVPYLRFVDSPIVIEGGKAVSVKFRSIEHINKQQDGNLALEIFHSGGVDAVLAIIPLTATKFSSEPKPVLAKAKLFRELSGTAILPANLLDSEP